MDPGCARQASRPWALRCNPFGLKDGSSHLPEISPKLSIASRGLTFLAPVPIRSIAHQIAKWLVEFAPDLRQEAVGVGEIFDGVERSFPTAFLHLHPTSAALAGAEQHPWAVHFGKDRRSRSE
jgi:hypothetical protein